MKITPRWALLCPSRLRLSHLLRWVMCDASFHPEPVHQPPGCTASCFPLQTIFKMWSFRFRWKVCLKWLMNIASFRPRTEIRKLLKECFLQDKRGVVLTVTGRPHPHGQKGCSEAGQHTRASGATRGAFPIEWVYQLGIMPLELPPTCLSLI